MKLTAKHLRHIILEEFAHVLLEQEEETYGEEAEETYRIHLASPPLPGHAGEPYMEEGLTEGALLEALGVVWNVFDRQGGLFGPEELEESDLLVVRASDNQVVAGIKDITWDAEGNATWKPVESRHVASMDADGDLTVLPM